MVKYLTLGAMILERIKQYIDYKSISVAAFEKSIGMSNASFGKCLKKGGAIGTDKLENILSVYPDISPDWLLIGKGNMLKGSGVVVAPHVDEEVGISERRHDVAVTFLQKHGLLACKIASHCLNWYKWYACAVFAWFDHHA